ncbi:SPOR domain-containing protein [Rheinheimera maricola]|uniref:SPOR domain-containing protein n=1 Tax=Rheinheimera maricola TaxID=2793282 RepID=A0ABS7X6N9_9GAMM|nr:SPOR domain-containing protein [Rheinheimera maricola]MBZ9611206.1 SPOR domain-containing protein [Rheinheimera maricola]
MPQKDYVKAGRPKAKPASRRPSRANNKAAASSPAKPWLLIVITTLLASGFIYFLWFLNQQPTVNPVPAKAASQPTKTDELPVKPTTEPYQYITELENKEVTVEVAEQQQSAGPYQMQCGSFRVEQQAETMKAQIAFAGFASQVRRTEGNNGVWFRVVLGPYESKRKATADMNRLRQQNINTCRIWNWT